MGRRPPALGAVLEVAGWAAGVNLVVALGLWWVLSDTTQPGTAPGAAVQRLAEMHAQRLAAMYANTAFRSVITNDYAALNAVMRQSASWPDVVYVSVEDVQGRILAHTDPTRIGKVWNDRLAAETRTALTTPYESVTAVMAGAADGSSRPIGRVRLGYIVDRAGLTGAQPAASRLRLWIVLAVAAALGLPVALAVTQLAPRPPREPEAEARSELEQLTVDLVQGMPEADARRELEKLAVDLARAKKDLSKRADGLDEARAELERHAPEINELRRTLDERAADNEALQRVGAERLAGLKRLEAELARLSAELKEARSETAQRLPGAAVASICQVFRSSLTTVLGYSKLLLRGTDGHLSEPQRTDVLSIQQAGTQLLTVVDMLADLVRAEAGTLEREATLVDLAAIARAAAGKPLAQGPTASPLLVQADSRHICHILEAMVAPGTTLPGDSEVLLSLAEDDGVAVVDVAHPRRRLTEGDLTTFFDPFPPPDAATLLPTDGSRLRLALARALTTLNGGRLSVEPLPGGGGRFTLRIPLAAQPPTPDRTALQLQNGRR